MPVDMDVVGGMAGYLSVARVCTAQPRETLPMESIGSASLHCAVHTVPLYTVQYTRATGKYAAITPTTSISTDMIEPIP